MSDLRNVKGIDRAKLVKLAKSIGKTEAELDRALKENSSAVNRLASVSSTGN